MQREEWDEVQYTLQTADTQDQGIALGWRDIQDLKENMVSKSYWDDTQRDGLSTRDSTLLKFIIALTGAISCAAFYLG